MKDSHQPAFPTTESNGCNSGTSGVTIRDYFAAKTLQGLMANVSVNNWVNPYENLAEASYSMADAMLKARQE